MRYLNLEIPAPLGQGCRVGLGPGLATAIQARGRGRWFLQPSSIYWVKNSCNACSQALFVLKTLDSYQLAIYIIRNAAINSFYRPDV